MYDGSSQHLFLTHKFTGKERDFESGLDNLGWWRTLDPLRLRVAYPLRFCFWQRVGPLFSSFVLSWRVAGRIVSRAVFGWRTLWVWFIKGAGLESTSTSLPQRRVART